MTADHTNEVKVNEQTKLVMKYPRLKDMNKVPENADDYSKMFLLLTNCIHEIHFDDKGHFVHNGDTGLQIIAPISINA